MVLNMKMIFPIVTKQTQELPFYLTGIGMQENQEHTLRPNGYMYYQMSFCIGGEGVFKYDGKIYEIKSGSGFYFRPNTPHEYYFTMQPWCVKWITFDGQKTHEIFNRLGLSDAGAFNMTDLNLFEILFDEIYLKVNSSYSLKELECSADIYKLLVLVGRSVQEHTSSPCNLARKKLAPVIEFMKQHLAASISLANIADEIGVSPYYLCRLFKLAYKSAPFKYLIQLRIQKAKQLLLENQKLTITKISYQCGFNDTSYFNAAFKQHEGITPGEFRRMHGQ